MNPLGARRKPAILRWRPDPTEDYTQSHLGRGQDYDDNFDAHPWRAALGELETSAVTDLITGINCGVQPQSVLVVACGTGRIAAVVAQCLPHAEIIGIDVADSMLAVARGHVPRARFIHADMRAVPIPVPVGSFDLVTAFRFFANAEPQLRADVAAAIGDALRPGGHVLLNNHRNFWSPSYLARRAGGRSGAPGAVNRSILAPFLDCGFRAVERRSLGVLPHSDQRAYLLPQGRAWRWLPRASTTEGSAAGTPRGQTRSGYCRRGSDESQEGSGAEAGGQPVLGLGVTVRRALRRQRQLRGRRQSGG